MHLYSWEVEAGDLSQSGLYKTLSQNKQTKTNEQSGNLKHWEAEVRGSW